MYNQQGQTWPQPPWNPEYLARSAYAPLRDMVRTVLRHAGALRVDHIIGLFRLWWIPEGMGADHGAYGRYDHEAMMGVILLEAQGAGAVVIGEDLGAADGECAQVELADPLQLLGQDVGGGQVRPGHHGAVVAHEGRGASLEGLGDIGGPLGGDSGPC